MALVAALLLGLLPIAQGGTTQKNNADQNHTQQTVTPVNQHGNQNSLAEKQDTQQHDTKSLKQAISSEGPVKTATLIPAQVQSRINIASDRTRTTPLRDSGNPVSAGFNHVLDSHFNREISNSRSVFTITPDQLKGVLQSSSVVKSPVTALPDGQYLRVVDVGRIIGVTTLRDGGTYTSVIKIFTDKSGNLITTFPTKAGN